VRLAKKILLIAFLFILYQKFMVTTAKSFQKATKKNRRSIPLDFASVWVNIEINDSLMLL
jgi:hypothetical protein